MIYLIERIAAYIAAHGNCSTRDIAAGLGESATRVGDSIKSERARARWGLKRLGYAVDSPGSGHAPNLWGIDMHKYRKYLSERKDMPWIANRLAPYEAKKTPPVVKKAKPVVKVPKEAIVPLAERPVYTGPLLTRWQPSSPYYKENP